MHQYSTEPTEYILTCTWNSKTFTSMHHYILCLPGYVLSMYSVRTGTYWSILGKTRKQMYKTFRFEQWISCIASCSLYNYATSLHSMVISILNTWYIAPETYTRVALCLLAGVGRWPRIQQRPRLQP